MAIRLDPVWKCDECGDIHPTEDAAYDCCPQEVTSGFMCPECAQFYQFEPDALDCCEHDPDAPPPPPSAADLESAGQQRLIP